MGKKLYLESTTAVPDKQRMPSPINPVVGPLKLWMSTRSDFDDKLAARKVSVKSATRRVLAATKDRRAWADHARDALDVETDPRYMRGAGRRDSSTPASRSARSAAPSEASIVAAAATAAGYSENNDGGTTVIGADGAADADGDGVRGDLVASGTTADPALEVEQQQQRQLEEPTLDGIYGSAIVAAAAAAAAAGGDGTLSGPSDGGGGGGGDIMAAQGSGDPEVASHDARTSDEAHDSDSAVDRAYWPRYDSIDLDSEHDASLGGDGDGARKLRNATSAAAHGDDGGLSRRLPEAHVSSASAASPRTATEKKKRQVGGGLGRRRGMRPKLLHPPPSLGAIRRKKLWCPMCCGMCSSAHAVEAAMHMLNLRGGGDASRRPQPKLSLYSLQSGATAFV